MDRWSFILGVAVAIILRKVVDVLGEPYHVASSAQVGEPKWVQPIKRLMDGGHEANRQLAVGDVLSAVAAQQLHHAHTLANALSASIEAPLALRSAVVGLGVRVLLALAAVWSMAPIARAGVRRLSRPRPAMRSWLAQVEQRLLGSPWLGRGQRGSPLPLNRTHACFMREQARLPRHRPHPRRRRRRHRASRAVSSALPSRGGRVARARDAPVRCETATGGRVRRLPGARARRWRGSQACVLNSVNLSGAGAGVARRRSRQRLLAPVGRRESRWLLRFGGLRRAGWEWRRGRWRGR